MISKLPAQELANNEILKLESNEWRFIDILQATKLMDEKIAKLRAMSRRLPLPDDVKDAGFEITRKLLDDLVLAGGKITVNHQGVEIHGVIRVGEDDFKQEIIGQGKSGVGVEYDIWTQKELVADSIE